VCVCVCVCMRVCVYTVSRVSSEASSSTTELGTKKERNQTEEETRLIKRQYYSGSAPKLVLKHEHSVA